MKRPFHRFRGRNRGRKPVRYQKFTVGGKRM